MRRGIGTLLPRLFTNLCLVSLAAGFLSAFLFRDWVPTPFELMRASQHFAENGVIGNPYSKAMTGPTAHVSPVAASIFAIKLFVTGGYNSQARFFAGILYSILTTTCIILSKIIVEKSVSKPYQTYAINVFCVFVVMTIVIIPDIIIDVRQWDQAFTTLHILALWWCDINLASISDTIDKTPRQKTMYMYILSILVGLSFINSPSVVPSAIFVLAQHVWYMRQGLSIQAVVNITTNAVVPPALWMLRNFVALGAPILTRSNFGLELAVGNMPGALGYPWPGGSPLHPDNSLDMALLVAQHGEVAFMAMMRGLAMGFIAADPATFLKLTIKRVWFWFFMDPMMLEVRPLKFHHAYIWVYHGFGAIKLLSLFFSISKLRLLRWAILFCVFPAAPYFITQMTRRYILVTHFPFIVLSSLVAIENLRLARRRKRNSY